MTHNYTNPTTTTESRLMKVSIVDAASGDQHASAEFILLEINGIKKAIIFALKRDFDWDFISVESYREGLYASIQKEFGHTAITE